IYGFTSDLHWASTMRIPFFAANWFILMCVTWSLAFADEHASAINSGDTFAAKDTLACGDEPNRDAKECLNNLVWTPAKFTVPLHDPHAQCGGAVGLLA